MSVLKKQKFYCLVTMWTVRGAEGMGDPRRDREWAIRARTGHATEWIRTVEYGTLLLSAAYRDNTKEAWLRA